MGRLEHAMELSGESVQCGECTLSKEAFDLCMKMNRSSRLKNKAIMMKIVGDAARCLPARHYPPAACLLLERPLRP